MKPSDGRRVISVLIGLGICLNLILAAAAWHETQARQETAEKNRAQILLEKLHSSFSFEKIYLERIASLFELVEGKESAGIEAVTADWFRQNFLPREAYEVVYFRHQEPLNVPADSAPDWKFLYSRVDCGKFRKYRTEGEEKNRLIKFLNGGVGFERLEGKPGQLRRMTISDRRSFGVWFSSQNKRENGIDGMMVLVHERFISEKLLAAALFDAVGIDRQHYGFVNLFSPGDSLLPAGLDPFHISSALSGFDVRSGFSRLQVDGKNLAVSYRPDGRVFLKEELPVEVPVPLWSWSLLFFWLPCSVRFCYAAGTELKLSLRALLMLVLVISMALPMAAISFYWKNFLESSRESIKIASAAKLQQHLIQLDASYQQIFRTTRKEFRQLIGLFDQHPENLQKFIDRSVQLEIDGMYDSCMLVNDAGQFIRPSAGASYAVRRLVFHDRPYREKVFEQFFSQGWVPFDLEAGYALDTPTENLDINTFVSLMPSQGKAAYSSFISFTSKDLINLHNSRLAGDSAPGKEQVSAMVMSSFMGSDDENPVSRIQQSLGDFFDFGFGVNQSINFVDLIKDASGRANYCVILFSGHYNYTSRFFNQIFTSRDRWPAGVKYMAVSERLFSTNYPVLDLWKRMHRLVGLMQPPRNMHVEETMINGEPHLLCAYVGRKCLGYILVAAVPLSEIDQKVAVIKTRMIFAALLVFAAFFFVLIRLNRGVVIPAGRVMNGVKALADRNHSHRIAIDTGDEWQQLAETFNSSLESMKELEVAHFVQTCLLPAEEIVSGGSVFAGRTVPADDVGGDYYDAFVPAEGTMVFVMGDVSGHSVSAALVVAMARAGFAAMVDSGVTMPDELFGQFNQLMLEHLGRVKMMTCFAGHIDASGVLTSSNAGQTFPFLIAQDGSVATLRNIGYPLGAAKKRQFRAEKIALPPRCRLVMFSDGVVEAMNEQGEPFGYERLESLLSRLGCEMARAEFFAAVYDELKRFAGPVPWADDVTIALVDYQNPAGAL